MKNQNKRTPAGKNRNISRKLFDALSIIEVLEDIVEENRKTEILISLLSRNIKFVFNEIEKRRKKARNKVKSPALAGSRHCCPE